MVSFSVLDDWKSIFGNPTKFGLGLITILFDLIFMLQHYILFRHPPTKKSNTGYKKIDESFNDRKNEMINENGGSHSSLSDEGQPLLGAAPKKSKLKQLLA